MGKVPAITILRQAFVLHSLGFAAFLRMQPCLPSCSHTCARLFEGQRRGGGGGRKEEARSTGGEEVNAKEQQGTEWPNGGPNTSNNIGQNVRTTWDPLPPFLMKRSLGGADSPMDSA